MNMLMGIGNDQGLDDGVGNYIANTFSHPDWKVINCATVPENFTSVIKKAMPDLLVLIDAAHMELEPGSVRHVPVGKLADVGAGTHALPLTMIINIMQPYVKQPICFIGIQPETMGEGEYLSEKVMDAAEKVKQCLANNMLADLEKY